MTDTPEKASAVAGHAARDNWLCAVLRDHDLTPITLKVAVRLGIFFNCKTGQCDPGYLKIAAELNVSRRSVMRAIATLEARGWLAVDGDPGGHLNRNFCLLMPTVEVTPDGTSRGDTALAPLKQKLEVTGSTFRGDKNRTLEVPPRCHTEPDEPENLKEAGLTTGRLVDRVLITEAETTAVSLPDPARTTAEPEPLRAAEAALKIPSTDRVRLDAPKELCGSLAANAADDGAAMILSTPGYDERQFQHLRGLYPNQDDEAGARFAFCAALREGATVDALVATAQRYGNYVANRASKFSGRTLAKFIQAGHWRDHQRRASKIGNGS
jgi:hypothetical protein